MYLTTNTHTHTLAHLYTRIPFVVIKWHIVHDQGEGKGASCGIVGGCTRADNKKCFTFQSTNNMAFNGQAKRARTRTRSRTP